MKIVVFCPYDYTTISGGIIALHKLYDNLRIMADTDTQVVMFKGETKEGVVSEDTVVVYPEVIRGNPLKAKNVVRWILNSTGALSPNFERTWSREDRYFLYDSLFKVQHSSQVVYPKLSTLEPYLDIFKVTNTGERKGNCHLFRKGGSKPRYWHQEDSICIDQYNGDFAKQAEIFNRCETFVSYDEHCFTTTQAALCGCLVIVVPKDGLSADAWYNELPTHKFGQSYGLSGIGHAIRTQPLLRGLVEDKVKESKEQAKEFLRYCKFWTDEKS